MKISDLFKEKKSFLNASYLYKELGISKAAWSNKLNPKLPQEKFTDEQLKRLMELLKTSRDGLDKIIKEGIEN